MFCKNCGKEMKDGDMFCRECGEKNESLSAQNNAVSDSNGGGVTVKKMSKSKLIIIAAFVILIIIVIACAISGNSGSDNKKNVNVEELFYSSSEGLNVTEYVYNRELTYEEKDEDLYTVKVKGKVQLGYIGSGVYENTTLTFELNTDNGSCKFIDSTNISWHYLLEQYQYNNGY